ncbi:MAG: hypothetical protein J0G30_11510 [Actinomycetales bacterium]|nr:hypothetical protein [Actinomycetales bacterium]
MTRAIPSALRRARDTVAARLANPPAPLPRAAGLLGATAALVAIAVLAGVLVGPIGGLSATGATRGPTLLRAPGQAPFLVAHRGDRWDAPESTLPAFEAGLAAGARILETDVRLTADGVPVLLHDADVDRTTDGTGALADLTLEQVRRLDAGSWFSPEFAGTRIPTLDEFLDLLAPSGASVFLEIKGAGWSADSVADLAQRLRDRGVADRVVVSSFSTKNLRWMRAAAPEIRRALATKQLPGDVPGMLDAVGAQVLLTLPESLEARPGLVGDLHRAGYSIVVFTPNSRVRWAETVELGVDGLVSDRPADFLAWAAARIP